MCCGGECINVLWGGVYKMCCGGVYKVLGECINVLGGSV